MRENLEIPIVDVSPLYSGQRDGEIEVARKIGEACRGIGFFYVAHHSVDAQTVQAAFEKGREFFALNDGAKDLVSFANSPHNRGYIGFQGEALNPAKPPDMKEAFNIGLDLSATDPEVVAGKPFRGVNLWPDVNGFRRTMLSYFNALWGLGRDLHRAFALDLRMPADHFDDKLNRPMATLRLLHYPALPSERQEGQLGAGEHTDYGNITLLATDEVGGLEVRSRTGEWLAAPVIPGTFVCNIGDCLMRWTNDEYVSTPHRVVNPEGRERYSIAFFLDPNPEAIVECLPSCTGPGRPAIYPAIRGEAFLRSRLDPTYSHNAPAEKIG